MKSTENRPKSISLWLWVVAAFVILIGAWTTLIVIAQKNKPQVIEVEKP